MPAWTFTRRQCLLERAVTPKETGAGLRWDLPRSWAYSGGFIRLLVGGEWIDFDEASSPVGYWQVRADFGARF